MITTILRWALDNPGLAVFFILLCLFVLDMVSVVREESVA